MDDNQKLPEWMQNLLANAEALSKLGITLKEITDNLQFSYTLGGSRQKGPPPPVPPPAWPDWLSMKSIRPELANMDNMKHHFNTSLDVLHIHYQDMVVLAEQYKERHDLLAARLRMYDYFLDWLRGECSSIDECHGLSPLTTTDMIAKLEMLARCG